MIPKSTLTKILQKYQQTTASEFDAEDLAEYLVVELFGEILKDQSLPMSLVAACSVIQSAGEGEELMVFPKYEGHVVAELGSITAVNVIRDMALHDALIRLAWKLCRK